MPFDAIVMSFALVAIMGAFLAALAWGVHQSG
jgi:hypothetical protein